MKKKLIKLLAPLYLGASLSEFANVHWYQWEFYAITIPFYILVTDLNKDS